MHNLARVDNPKDLTRQEEHHDYSQIKTHYDKKNKLGWLFMNGSPSNIIDINIKVKPEYKKQKNKYRVSWFTLLTLRYAQQRLKLSQPLKTRKCLPFALATIPMPIC